MSTELAWAAGFFDGEGSIYIRNTARHKGGTTGKMYPLLTVEISIAQVRPEPLDRFLRAVGFGGMGGPYKVRTKNHNAYYRWDTAGRPSAARLAALLWPYLSAPKKEQWRQCWSELRDRATPKSPKLPPLPED